MKRALFNLFALCLCLVFVAPVMAQEPTPEPPAGTTGPQRPGPGGAASQDPQPYEKVITKDAKSKDGIFKVHKVKDKYFYEIPKDQLGREFLWVTQIARTTLGVGYGGQSLGRRVVQWERNDNRILLRNINYNVVADPKSTIAEAVRMRGFEFLAEG